MTPFGFDIALRSALGDPDQRAYSAEARSAATLRAVREYSRYRPCLRRYGTGNLCAAAAAGAPSLLVSGGTFSRGDTILLDPFTDDSETLTVLRAARFAAVDEGGAEPAGSVLQITLAAPLAYAHCESAFVTRQTPGMNLVGGQDTYALPLDWQRPDQNTFDEALGRKSSVSKTDAYYDASVAISSQLSGVGYGAGGNWGPGYSYGSGSGSYPIVGNPAFNPNGVGGGGGGTGGNVSPGSLSFRFLNQSPPMMTVRPVPSGPANLDFFYFGGHTLGTVPDADMEPLLAYACYVACEARAATINEKGDHTYGDQKEAAHFNSAELRALAASHLAKFNTKIRYVPYITSG